MNIKNRSPREIEYQEEMEAEKRGLRVLLDSFRVKPECELETRTSSKRGYQDIGQFIAALINQSRGRV
jgi:hypothetical protein